MTDRLLVSGGARLDGTVRIAGAKNSALKLMAAAILTDEPVELGNVPAIADVPVMAVVLRGLGVEVTVDRQAGTCRLRAVDPHWHAPADAVS
ncbi:MAG: UDP-N-acetylglucosamine 1-carboxyvinyltransferase, partial [Actinomycetota bacterium]